MNKVNNTIWISTDFGNHTMYGYASIVNFTEAKFYNSIFNFSIKKTTIETEKYRDKKCVKALINTQKK